MDVIERSVDVTQRSETSRNLRSLALRLAARQDAEGEWMPDAVSAVTGIDVVEKAQARPLIATCD